MVTKKKTKIVATIGPATESEEMLLNLIVSGMNVMRLNFSHGDFAEHQTRVDNLRRVVEKTNKPIAILQDLSGPKIRIGEFSTERVNLKEGEIFTITTEKIIGDEKKVSINYPLFPKEVKVGGFVLLDDGKKKLEIVRISGNEVECKILVGGDTKGRRGVNLPSANLSVSSVTDKDREDIKFGLKNEVDFFALSFVRKPEDVLELRSLLNKAKSRAGIIAKIETPQALENIDEIIRLSDGIMVARGDLAIEVPAETVPMVQKMIIGKCNQAGKPVITATQMLESMIKSPVPTRAEVSDIANAILDGTDAVMLSEETTLGAFPVEAVKVMARIALQIEKDYPEKYELSPERKGMMDVTDAITGSAVNTAHDIGATLVIALTESGFTARMISRYKPTPIIVSLTPNRETWRKLALSFGCYPILVKHHSSLSEVFKEVREICLERKLAVKGDKVVISAGAPLNVKSVKTNSILVEEI